RVRGIDPTDWRRALGWRRDSYMSRRFWLWICTQVFIVFCNATIIAGVLLWCFEDFLVLSALPHAVLIAIYRARVARKACNRKHAGEQQFLHQYLPLANIDAPPRIVPAMTLASVGGGAATIGALVQKMPMPPGLGGVSRPLVALILP